MSVCFLSLSDVTDKMIICDVFHSENCTSVNYAETFRLYSPVEKVTFFPDPDEEIDFLQSVIAKQQVTEIQRPKSPGGLIAFPSNASFNVTQEFHFLTTFSFNRLMNFPSPFLCLQLTSPHRRMQRRTRRTRSRANSRARSPEPCVPPLLAPSLTQRPRGPGPLEPLAAPVPKPRRPPRTTTSSSVSFLSLLPGH